MIAVRLALGAIIAATTISASTDELQLFARLLKRQEPGSASYNCHDNCGQAIIQGRSSSDACNDNIFLTDYKACLQCAGPDNQDIWQYYGGTLTTDASKCGLSTTPLSGKQPDVGPALAASTSGTSVAQSATSSSTAEPTSEATTTDAPTSTVVFTTTPTTSETTASALASASESGSASVTWALTSTGSGSGSGNGTATTSSGVVVVSNAANAFSGSTVGFYGALALGALYAAAQ
ncbi:hypothetical protein GGR54DRAFT_649991 [Hypoxylon sp. NC1633]|nr:hypothetical protein GGR54DRAFT_649991 [Hypoxylon sp. NC1633]